MKIIIKEDPVYDEPEVQVRYAHKDPQVKRILSFLSGQKQRLIGRKNGEDHIILPESIYYIESVDNKVFIYNQEDIFESSMRLYQIEELLNSGDFFRASKSTILNISKIEKLKPAFGRKLLANLDNNEQVLISRQYVPVLKQKLGMGGKSK